MRGVDGPVELGSEEVHPATPQPQQRVGVDARVRVEPGDRRRHAGTGTRPIETERTDAELRGRTQ